MTQEASLPLKNLQNILKYINQETEKKIQLIRKEGTQVVEIEKSHMQKQEKENVRKRFEKELEEFVTKLKISQSQKMSKLRLEKLKVKIDYVNAVFDEAKTHLQNKIRGQPEYYKNVLKNLIVQGFIKLLDENVNIICRKEDYELVCSLVEESKKIFLEMLTRETRKYKHFQINTNIDNKYFLPDYLIGGVMITSLKNKIRLDNTLDKRLELLKQRATPRIREILFKNFK